MKNEAELIKPYDDNAAKKAQVAEMFDNISARYDLLNHLLSLNIDKLWRKKAVKLIRPFAPKQILDVATGTGDFAIELKKLNPDYIRGIDISAGMLDVGNKKMRYRRIDHIISLELGDAENIKAEDSTYEAVTVAFGVRNFDNLKNRLSELNRVLKSGYPLAVLEFSKPRAFPMKQLYNFYFSSILPLIGKTISKDARAYTYLPESVKAFSEGADFIHFMKEAGFKSIKEYRLTFGIATIYLGIK